MKEEKRFVVYMATAFTAAWIMQAGAVFSIYSGKSVLYTILLSVSMYTPFLGVLVSHKGLKKAKTGIGWGISLKKNWKYFLGAWFLPIVLTVTGAAIYFAVMPEKFDIHCGSLAKVYGSLLDADGNLQGIPLGMVGIIQFISAVTYAPIINMFAALGEEAGWRGYMTPALEKWMGKKAALVVSGIIWAIWHGPLIVLAGYEYGTGYAGEPFLGILMMCGFTTAMGIVLSYFYEKSQSIWVPALMHGALNGVAGVSLLYMKEAPMHYLLGPTPAGLLSGIPLFALGVFLFMKLGKKVENDN